MPVIARLGLPLLAHAELPGPIERAAVEIANLDPHRYATWLAARPPEAEHLAIAVLISLARATGCRVHIVHLSSAAAIPMLRSARGEGLPITVETCPHYLFFAAEDVPDGATQYKCAPPIRERGHRERLWEALRDGDIDMIATDHSPCLPVMKEPHAGFLAAWGGIASLELGLGAVWTEARRRGFKPEDVARWMSAAPARLAGLEARKGRIAVGADGDLVVWNPEGHTPVEPRRLHQKHPVTPYVGLMLGGRVERTYLRGTCVFDGTSFPGTPHGVHVGAERLDSSRAKP
jgi:allantoinase